MTRPTARERANSIYMSIRAEVRPGQFLRDAIERAITAAEEAVRADEREACAKLAAFPPTHYADSILDFDTCDFISESIRARSKEPT